MKIKCKNCDNVIKLSNKHLVQNADLICCTYVMECSKCKSVVVFTSSPKKIMHTEKDVES